MRYEETEEAALTSPIETGGPKDTEEEDVDRGSAVIDGGGDEVEDVDRGSADIDGGGDEVEVSCGSLVDVLGLSGGFMPGQSLSAMQGVSRSSRALMTSSRGMAVVRHSSSPLLTSARNFILYKRWTGNEGRAD